jgi:hypothetical protein
MWSRTVTAAAVAVGAACVVAGCNPIGTSDEAGSTSGTTPSASASASPGGSTTAQAGPFTMPGSACDLVKADTVASVAGRDSVKLTPLGGTPTGSDRPVLTCTFTDGVVPVGLLTVDVRSAGENRTAAQELDASVAGSVYKSTSDTQDVPGLADAAKYGTAMNVGGLTYASVWTVTLGDGVVGDVSVTLASHTPDAARPGIVDLARTALTGLTRTTAGATPSATVNPETGP